MSSCVAMLGSLDAFTSLGCPDMIRELELSRSCMLVGRESDVKSKSLSGDEA